MTAEDFWNEVAALIKPIETVPIVYRLYHDDQGHPISYSTDLMPGNYIEISQEDYNLSSSHVRVVDGKLVKLQKISFTEKLCPSRKGTVCSDTDITIIVKDKKNYKCWKLKTYEPN